MPDTWPLLIALFLQANPDGVIAYWTYTAKAGVPWRPTVTVTNAEAWAK